jgi:hypothetical protein
MLYEILDPTSCVQLLSMDRSACIFGTLFLKKLRKYNFDYERRFVQNKLANWISQKCANACACNNTSDFFIWSMLWKSCQQANDPFVCVLCGKDVGAHNPPFPVDVSDRFRVRTERAQWLSNELAMACQRKDALNVRACMEFVDVTYCRWCKTCAHAHLNLEWMIAE